ncbi:MAG: helix-turn-helix domain-containing protein [Candidatus Ornithomonoglobus sp.]
MNKNIIISHVKHDPHFTVNKFHSHAQYEITYLFKGNRKYTIGSKVFSAAAHSFIFTNKNTSHKTEFEECPEYERFSIYFTDEFLTSHFNAEAVEDILKLFDTSVLKLTEQNVGFVEGILHKAESEYRLCGKYSPVLVELYTAELFIYILRMKLDSMSENFGMHHKSADFISQVTQYIIDNYSNPITLTDTAAYMHLSPSWFSSKFKTCAGLGFREYLTRVRVQKACEMLLDTNLSITQIAMDTGFNDSNYFGSAFKKVTGISPRNYRKNNT